MARIEVPKNQINIFDNTKVIDEITKELKELGFKFVTLDLEGYRKGSMLETLDK